MRSVVLSTILGCALVMACSRPRAVEPPAPAAAGKAAAAETAAKAPDPALLLSADELNAYLQHLVPLGTELAALDAKFAARYKGTAVAWDDLVDPATLAARDGLATRHGYASWAAFAKVHGKVVGAMGLAVARVLRGINVAANVNKGRELEKQAADPATAPDQKAKLEAVKADLARRTEEMRARPIGRADVPEANLEVLAPHRTELTALFKQLRDALKKKADEAKAAAAPAPTAAATPAATPAPAAPQGK